MPLDTTYFLLKDKVKKRASNFPAFVVAMVASIASWPPPNTTWE